MSKVLIVDYDRTVSKSVKATLEGNGFNVIEAEDGVGALQYICGVVGTNEQPDVVIVDHRISGISGYQLVKDAQVRGFTGHIIVYSTSVDTATFIEYQELGAVFMPKRLNSAELIAEVSKTLTKTN